MDLNEAKVYKNVGNAMCLLEFISFASFVFLCVHKYQTLNYPMLLISYMIFLLVSMLTLFIIRGSARIVNVHKRFANDIMAVKNLAEDFDALALSSMKKIPKLKAEYMFAAWRVLFYLGTVLFLAMSFAKIL